MLNNAKANKTKDNSKTLLVTQTSCPNTKGLNARIKNQIIYDFSDFLGKN